MLLGFATETIEDILSKRFELLRQQNYWFSGYSLKNLVSCHE